MRCRRIAWRRRNGAASAWGRPDPYLSANECGGKTWSGLQTEEGDIDT